MCFVWGHASINRCVCACVTSAAVLVLYSAAKRRPPMVGHLRLYTASRVLVACSTPYDPMCQRNAALPSKGTRSTLALALAAIANQQTSTAPAQLSQRSRSSES